MFTQSNDKWILRTYIVTNICDLGKITPKINFANFKRLIV